MKRLKLKYYLPVLVLITGSLLSVAFSAFLRAKRGPENGMKMAGSETTAQLRPMSRLKITVELAEKAELKTQAFLKFFETPTKQLMPLGFYAIQGDMRDVQKLRMLGRSGIILFHKYASEQSVKDLGYEEWGGGFACADD